MAGESFSVGNRGAVPAQFGLMVGRGGSFAERVFHHASTRSEHCAVTVVDSDLEVTGQLTHAQLAKRSRALGAWLQSHGASGRPVVLVLPTGLDFVTSFFACLVAGAVVVPAVPPRTRPEAERLVGIVDDCSPPFVLTCASLRDRVASQLEGRDVDCVAIEDAAPVTAGARSGVGLGAVGGEHPALIQYTSGSTSKPRGAVVSHDNLLANEAMIIRAFGITEQDVVVSWLPVHHDMGLMGGLLAAVYAGGHAVLLAPSTFLRRPIRWLEAIERFKGTLSGAPNFAYELCCQRIPEKVAGRLDLRHWRVAFCGAEPVRAATLERFAARFAAAKFSPAAFLPCYGLAEATLMVSGGGRRPVIASFDASALQAGKKLSDAAGRALVGCGTVPAELTVRIVDPQSRRPCAAGVIGEIWVAGPSVGLGYWRDPQATEQTFGARLADGDERYLRTGDLGFFDQDNLFVTGRLKSAIIVHGRNHDAADLEWTAARAHAALRPAGTAAFAVDTGSREQVVIVQELERSFKGDLELVAGVIRGAVAAAHEVRVDEVVLTHDRLPRTTSNKIQRFAVRGSLDDGSLGIAHRSLSVAMDREAVAVETERGALRKQVAAAAPSERRRMIADFVLAQIALALGPEVAATLDPARPLQELGLDSLTGVQLRDALGLGADLDLPATFALDQPTLEGLVQELLAGMAAADRVAKAAGDAAVGGEEEAANAEAGFEADLAVLLEEIEGLEDDVAMARLYEVEPSPSALAADDE